MPRFAVLEHQGSPGEVHWDLLLERGDVLLTYRLPRPPVLAPGESVEATRIRDHRPLYLDFEGELGRGLGRVRAFDRGTYEGNLDEEAAGGRRTLRLAGGRLSGRFAIEPPSPEASRETFRLVRLD